MYANYYNFRYIKFTANTRNGFFNRSGLNYPYELQINCR